MGARLLLLMSCASRLGLARERPRPFRNIERLMRADEIDGAVHRHDLNYEDEDGRHISIKYEVEHAPGLEFERLDENEHLLEIAGNGTDGEMLLHFSEEHKALEFHDRVRSRLDSVLVGGAHWRWRSNATGRTTKIQPPPVLTRVVNVSVTGTTARVQRLVASARKSAIRRSTRRSSTSVSQRSFGMRTSMLAFDWPRKMSKQILGAAALAGSRRRPPRGARARHGANESKTEERRAAPRLEPNLRFIAS